MKQTIEERRAYQKRYHRNLRKELIEAYGSKCNCCGESTFEFLSLDHIDSDGSIHRRKHNTPKTGGCSNLVWIELKRLNWPKDKYQLLCYNCNMGRHRAWDGLRICPHKKPAVSVEPPFKNRGTSVGGEE